MKSLRIGPNEEGQRFDKYLKKLLSKAPDSFLYKMLRKKNITLNGKKAAGSEKLKLGDEVKFFLSEETFSSFLTDLPEAKRMLRSTDGGEKVAKEEVREENREATTEPPKKTLKRTVLPGGSLKVLYEDAEVLIVAKPAGVLSQPDASGRWSMCEYVTEYLLNTGALSEEELRTFHPGVCNRLDYHTSGLLCAGKTLYGTQQLSRLFASREVKKEYLALVEGYVKEPGYLKAYLHKDEKCNKVGVVLRPEEGAVEVITSFTPLIGNERASLLLVELHTGKTHQIRAQMATISHPLLGDLKYGNGTGSGSVKGKASGSKKGTKNGNEKGVRSGSGKTNAGGDKSERLKPVFSRQMLHAYRLSFPALEGRLQGLSGKQVVALPPEDFKRALKEVGLVWPQGLL